MGSSMLTVLGASAGSKPVLLVVRPAELLPQPLCSAVPASSSTPIPAWANRFISSPIALGKCADNAQSVNPTRTTLSRKIWRNAAQAGAKRQNTAQGRPDCSFVGRVTPARRSPSSPGCTGVAPSSPSAAAQMVDQGQDAGVRKCGEGLK